VALGQQKRRENAFLISSLNPKRFKEGTYQLAVCGFIGRWSPFHEGHQALIESVLTTGKPVVIAIRDTEPSTENPYATSERWAKIQTELNS
jgi:phosphopantetheine adenylyltransferase